jgi:hypothetical protein
MTGNLRANWLAYSLKYKKEVLARMHIRTYYITASAFVPTSTFIFRRPTPAFARAPTFKPALARRPLLPPAPLDDFLAITL